jgi:hypothetical protein
MLCPVNASTDWLDVSRQAEFITDKSAIAAFHFLFVGDVQLLFLFLLWSKSFPTVPKLFDHRCASAVGKSILRLLGRFNACGFCVNKRLSDIEVCSKRARCVCRDISCNFGIK